MPGGFFKSKEPQQGAAKMAWTQDKLNQWQQFATSFNERCEQGGKITGEDIGRLRFIAFNHRQETNIDDFPTLILNKLMELGRQIKKAVIHTAKLTGISAKELSDGLVDAESISWQHAIESANTRKPSKPEPKKRNGTANAKMLAKIQADPDSRGWKIKQWMGFLKVKSPATVHATPAWKQLSMFRDEQNATRALDRHRKNTPRRRI
jgi:hypothetical protein